MLWKVEPLSPSGTPPLDIDEEWLNFDEKPAVLESSGEEPTLYEQQLTRAQVATKFLEELELKTWIKEESFADWLEEKIDLPIFEELPVPDCNQSRGVVYADQPVKHALGPLPQPHVIAVAAGHHHHHQQQPVQQSQQLQHHQHQQVDSTQSLLREFETVLGDVEACHQITGAGVIPTLTPPQSPPPLAKQRLLAAAAAAAAANGANAHLLVSLQPFHHAQAATFIYEQQHQQRHEEPAIITNNHHQQQQQQHSQQEQPAQNYTVTTLPLTEAIIEQQIAEQWNAENLSLVPLVHGTDVAHELAKVDEYVRNCAEDAVATTSSNASSSVSSPSPPSPCTSSNASCTSSEDSADDPDWSYEVASSSSPGQRRVSQARSGRRAKPYSRPSVEDKRVRKKEQNKNAATRYRQKKKQEIKEILGEEQELANKNEKLQVQLKDLQREIGYLKGLMRDLFKAKGLMK
jgi:cyclic AMP-dependent transcription factor ATF-4